MGNIDEKLMAYIDGDLDKNDRADVEKLLASSPDLSKRLEAMRASDAQLRDMFSEDQFNEIRPDTQLLASKLVDKLGQAGETEHQAEATGNVISFQAKPRTHSIIRAFVPQAIAASVALFVGFGAGYFGPGKSDTNEGAPNLLLAGIVPEGSTLHEALETQVSQQYPAMAAGSGPQAVPLTSFKTADGTFCREYAVATQEGGTRGLACKDKSVWRIQLAVAAETGSGNTGGNFIPASSDSMGPVDTLIMSMMSGDALGPEQEKSAIKGGWTPAK